MSRSPEHNAKIAASMKARGKGQSATKVCPRCKTEKSRSDFAPRGSSGYVDSYCRPCKREYGAERQRQYHAAHPELREHRRLVNQRANFKRHYGITVDEFERMKAAQGGVCAICEEPPKGARADLCIDHDHDTGAVRGLLCNPCNLALGGFQDSAALTLRAHRYLLSAATQEST